MKRGLLTGAGGPWMQRMGVVLLVIAGFAISIDEASGQQRSSVVSGSRVRLRVPGEPYWVTGRVVAATPTHVRLLRLSGDTLNMNWEGIERLQISLERRSHAGRGAALGGIIGGGAGLAFGLSLHKNGFLSLTDGEVAQVTAIGLAGGAAIGALIGMMARTDRWAEVELAADVRTLVATPRGIGFRVR